MCRSNAAFTDGSVSLAAILSDDISSLLTTFCTDSAMAFFFFVKTVAKSQRMARSFVPAPMAKPTAP